MGRDETFVELITESGDRLLRLAYQLTHERRLRSALAALRLRMAERSEGMSGRRRRTSCRRR